MMGYRLRTPKKCHKNVFEYTKINIEIQISHLFFPINKYLKKIPMKKYPESKFCVLQISISFKT